VFIILIKKVVLRKKQVCKILIFECLKFIVIKFYPLKNLKFSLLCDLERNFDG